MSLPIGNLEHYSSNFLKILDKKGEKIPFIFNKAQLYVHQKLEEQKRKLGYVRAIICKARQEGMSTYIGARFFHNSITNFGKKVFILSHQAKTTDKLFRDVKFFYDNLSESLPSHLIPELETSNRNEIQFKGLDSSYYVGTAGSVSVGRGFTTHSLHLSEAAYYEKFDEIDRGLIQSVPDVEGTEIIFESTSNGMNYFYDKVMKILDKNNNEQDYQLIFVPWFWGEEYFKPIKDNENWELTLEEKNLKELYNLTNEQLNWRRNKIFNLEGGESAFKQEYPCDILESFQAFTGSFIPNDWIIRAQNSNVIDTVSPVVMGVDPARSHDRIAFVFRKGRQLLDFETFNTTKKQIKSPELADMIASRIKSNNVTKCFIDEASGYGAIDILRANGFSRIVEGISFGSRASQSQLYLNKRAEMIFAVKDWLEQEVSIPKDTELQADLLCIPVPIPPATGKWKILSKHEIKKEFGKSPDLFDALALTFARPVFTEEMLSIVNKDNQRRKFKKNGHVLKTYDLVRSVKYGK